MNTARIAHRSRLAALLGGVLWMAYGVFEMLEPWGSATVYREDIGYEVVTDAPLYLAYSLPGSLALLLSSLALLGLFSLLPRPAARAGRVAKAFVFVAVGLGALSLAGVAARFDPLFTSGRVFGTLVLGGSTLLAGMDIRESGKCAGWTSGLFALGLLGMLLLPLWPLVYAVGLLSEATGAATIGLFGLGWLLLGVALSRDERGRDAEPAKS